MTTLKTSLISLMLLAMPLLLTGGYGGEAKACYGRTVERWYMFCFRGDDTFRSKYDISMNSYWRKYIGADAYYDEDMMLEAADKKKDTAMRKYILALRKYTAICQKIRQDDQWEYPTAQELQQRKRTLQSIANTCAANANSKYADRWLLLNMRANMLLKRHQQNVTLWQTKAKSRPDGMLKEMMRNIYANALLNTGKKREAWNIYAEQDDQESLRWTVRKFTNLAGIKNLCQEDPDAPVMNVLLEYYVNNVQDVFDAVEDGTEEVFFADYTEPAYAKIDKDFRREVADFSRFAADLANSGKTSQPCLWMAASALTSYFLKDFAQAETSINKALGMNGEQNFKDMARRIRMLITPAASDINSAEFKKFMVGELQWLDQCIKDVPALTDEYNSYGSLHNRLVYARDRILNLALAKAYNQRGDINMAIALRALQAYCKNFDSTTKDGFNFSQDHATESFEQLFALSANGIEQYFDFVKSHAGDPLAQYVFGKVKYSDNYANDLIGTKHLAEGNFQKALTYLEKVDIEYLRHQAIAPYAAKRDYKIPAWNGFQKMGFSYDDMARTDVYVPALKDNVKVRFAKEMVALLNEYGVASAQRRQELALSLAANYYQASFRGQCWFITGYSSSSYHTEDECKSGDFHDKAQRLLKEAAQSSVREVKTKALFAIAGTQWDYFLEENYDWQTEKTTFKPLRDTRHYQALRSLNDYMKTGSYSTPEISRCDILKTFRKYQ